MPQDSVTVINNLADTSQLPDSVKAILNDPEIRRVIHQDNNMPREGVVLYVYLSFILCIIVIPPLIRRIRSQLIRKKLAKEYESKEVIFDNILQHYNPYYRSLGVDGRSRFMQRAIVFMESKEFKYVEIEPEDIMPLLISGAAVQLTFGLENYMLDYFKTIYVVRDKYTYGLFNVPFEGHVNDKGIYLSWNNFIREYNNYTDGENLGLHELAHALVYVNFTVHDGVDDRFHDKFKDFSKVGRPIFERMHAGETNLLNKYAATDYNEFWAVCVETFFERSAAFKQQMPDLYLALCNLLNQDPLTPGKIISLIERA